MSARVLAVLLALLLTACASSLSPKPANPSRFAPWSPTPVPYRFEDGDELDVRLIYNPEFSDRVQVNPDGLIHLQLVGAVKAADRTPEELAEDIRERYARELRRPEVSVVPRSFASQVVYVGGEVQKPGPITLRGNAKILEVVFAAGGFTPLAYQREVIVIRRSSQNTPMLRTVDLRRLLQGDFSQDIQMARYDIVYVPRSKISDVDQWVDQWLNQTIPFSRGFSYSYATGPLNARTTP
jgi:protein involved in polysaccharide export with SLBB domain